MMTLAILAWSGNCGPGKKDKVFFDEGFDTVTGCEKKNPGQ